MNHSKNVLSLCFTDSLLFSGHWQSNLSVHAYGMSANFSDFKDIIKHIYVYSIYKAKITIKRQATQKIFFQKIKVSFLISRFFSVFSWKYSFLVAGLAREVFPQEAIHTDITELNF